MSAYGQEMEREYSAQSILAGEGSEMGSHYTTEDGIFMSSFTATVFISGLATVSISVLSLLVALTVMLNSCEQRSSGDLEIFGIMERYEYCRSFALHLELNSLNSEHFPTICKDFNTRYVKEGQYKRDLNITVAIAEDFFSSISLKNDGRDVVLMDADDFFTSETMHANQLMYWSNKNTLRDIKQEANYLRHIFALKLYLKLKHGQWSLILFSRKPEKLSNYTMEYLISVGCHGWSALIMRKDNEMQIDYEEYISRRRSILQQEGVRINAVISSRMDALRGPYLGDRVFKLPYPIFKYSNEDDDEELQQV